jgi:DNA mismatch endonuclease (patch repair protein)
MDKITPERRSANMARIRSTNTKPEMIVRRIVHKLGYRYRLHRRNLPGKPDLVFVSRKKIVLVHGCYWHGHGCTVGGTGAKSNRSYWGPKIVGNQDRDKRNLAALKRLGWRVLVIWECQTRDTGRVALRITRFLGRP